MNKQGLIQANKNNFNKVLTKINSYKSVDTMRVLSDKFGTGLSRIIASHIINKNEGHTMIFVSKNNYWGDDNNYPQEGITFSLDVNINNKLTITPLFNGDFK